MRHTYYSMIQLRRCIIAMAVVCALTACSLATLAYNNAGMLVGYALDGYVELTREQEIWLKERVNSLIAWHRSNELPEWHRWLNETRDRAAGKPQASDVQAAYARGRALLDRTTEQMLPDMAALLRQLDSQQIAFLESKFARDNRKMAEDIALPLAARKSKRLERMRERFESWLGNLTVEQIGYLQARVMGMELLDEMRLADRQRWQREFADLIKSRPELPVLHAELRRQIISPGSSRDAAYQAALTRQQEEIMTITAWLVTNATPAQKARLQKKLSGYADDVAGLLRA